MTTISSPHLWILFMKICWNNRVQLKYWKHPHSGVNVSGKNEWDSLSFSLLGLPTFCASCWLLDMDHLSALLLSRRVMNFEFLNYKFSKSWTVRVGLMLAWPVATICSPHLWIFIHGYVETVVYSNNIENIDNWMSFTPQPLSIYIYWIYWIRAAIKKVAPEVLNECMGGG